jgi:HEAT repeat protein
MLLGLAQPGCAEYLGTTAASFLRKVRESPDPNIRYIAYAKLASPNCYDDDQQKAEVVRTLITKLEKGGEPIATRAVICHTLGELHDRRARPVIVKAANDPEPVVKTQACRALGKVGRPEDATVLARIMTVDPLEDCRIAAIEGLAELNSNDPRILAMLVDGMDHQDPAFRLASLKALRAISGKDLGVEPAPWRKYVQAQSDAAAPKSDRR